MRILCSAIVAAALAVAAPAAASTITFDTAPFGLGFTGPVTENGYTYQQTFGFLLVNSRGVPGLDMEALADTAGGAIVIYRQDGKTFRFSSIDFAAFEPVPSHEQALSLVGVTADGSLVQDYYTLATTDVRDPTYNNWTTEWASGLAGVELKSLAIELYSIERTFACYSAVDNVVLAAPNENVPEPASLALLAGGLFWMRRNKKNGTGRLL